MHPTFIWRCSAYAPGGYDDEARAFLRAVESLGRKPELSHMNWTEKRTVLTPEMSRLLGKQERRWERRSSTIPPNLQNTVMVHHHVPGLGMHVETTQSCIQVARCMFETDRMPMGWLIPLLQMDEVWVPTPFNYQTFVESGLPEERVKIIGGTLDFDHYDPQRTDLPDLVIPGLPEDHTVFLSNFDFSERKGWKQLILAWARAFSPKDPVCLLLKTGSFYKEEGYVQQRVQSFLDSHVGQQTAPIVVMDANLSSDEMVSLYQAADCFVLPSRGEGWGRPYMEALAMGVPTIASNWSAHTHFIRSEYAWLVDGKLVDVPAETEVFSHLYQGHKWFEVDVDELVRAMQEVASDPQAARRKTAPARDRLIEDFNPRFIGQQIIAMGDEVWTQRHERNSARPVIFTGMAQSRSERQILDMASDLVLASDHHLDRRLLPATKLDPPVELTEGMLFELPGREANQWVLWCAPGFVPSRTWASQADENLDLVLASSAEQAEDLQRQGISPGKVQRTDSPSQIVQALRQLLDQRLPARHAVLKAEVESKAHTLMLAVDEDNLPDAVQDLEQVSRIFSEDDPVTVLLYCDLDEQSQDEALQKLGAVLPENGAVDVSAAFPGEVGLESLVCTVERVLVSDPQSLGGFARLHAHPLGLSEQELRDYRATISR